MNFRFLAGDGEMARLLRAHDWSRTALGTPDTWSQSLRTCVRIMLNTRHPVFLFWGVDAVCLYNDGYRELIGPERHAIALGNKGAFVWEEIWDVIGPQVAQVMAGGEATWHENQLIPVTRNGHLDQAYWTYSYSPVDDETVPNGVGGTLVLVSETTKTVLAEQQRAEETERFVQLFDQAPTFMGVLRGPEHRFEFVNPAYQQLIGDREVIGLTVVEAIPEATGQGYIALLNGVYSSGEAYRGYAIPFSPQPADGSPAIEHFLDFVYQPIRDAGGDVTGIMVVGVDQTDRTLADAALRTGEEQLRLATDAAEIALFDYDAVNDALFWTPRLYAMYGMNPGSPINLEENAAAMHPDDRAFVLERLVDVRDPAIGVMGDLQYRTIGRDDGVVRWIEARGQGIFAPDGACLRVVGTCLDITTRKEAEIRRDALIQLTDEMRGVSDPVELSMIGATILGQALGASRVGFGTVHPMTDELRVDRDWNAPGVDSIAGVLNLRDFGTFVDDLKAGRFIVIDDVLTDPSTAPAAQALIDRHARAFVNVALIEDNQTVAVLYVNSAKPRNWIAEDLALIREFAERIRNSLARLRAEAELKALAATLEQQVEERTRERDRVWSNAQDAIIVIDQTGTFTDANPAMGKILGWPEAEFIGKNIFDFIHEDDVEPSLHVFEHAKRESIPPFANRYRHKDGTFRHIAWAASPEDGLVYAYGRDVTAEAEQTAALAQVEEALRQAQKMEAVGQLTGGIAHDFNNMLAVVLGSLELVKRRIGEEDARTKRQLDAASDAAKRAANLTQRLLAFSRQQPLQPETINANKLVSNMSDLLHHSIGADIRLETVLAAGLWSVHVDPNQLENVILNLAVNARDAMAGGGRITIETQNAHLDRRYVEKELGVPAGQYVMLAVSDTGSGMPASVIAKAFDPFFTTKEVGKGTGLGLSQVYGFVKQSGGHIKIYSEIDQGTTIKIYLPRADDVPNEIVDDGLAGFQASQRETILVVDDEPAVRQFSVDALMELGYIVFEADSAAAALKVLIEHPEIELLFTDIVMPDTNGRKLADHAQRIKPDLKVLYTTGYTRNAVVHNGVVDKGVELIGKPFTLDELAARVRELLDKF